MKVHDWGQSGGLGQGDMGASGEWVWLPSLSLTTVLSLRSSQDYRDKSIVLSGCWLRLGNKAKEKINCSWES